MRRLSFIAIFLFSACSGGESDGQVTAVGAPVEQSAANTQYQPTFAEQTRAPERRSDVIIASDKAVIGDPHVKVGLVAGDGGALIWPQLLGYARAKEFLMTGEMLTAERAHAIGLINHVVPHDALDAKVAEIAARILANPKMAVRWTKVSANIPLRALAAQVLDAAMAYELVSNSLDDRREAVSAFVEKRTPNLTGD